jgi:RNA polymerase sigma-70 factor, ECF subfamily
MNTGDTLLPAAKKMDKDALSQIFDRYAPAIYNYILRHCQDPVLADQLVGDVFANLLEQFSLGAGPVSNLRAYLYETAFHFIVDETRYVHRRVSIEITDFFPVHENSPQIALENQMELEAIWEAMIKLSPFQRHVIILRILEGFSLKETAAILGRSVDSIKVTQFRAMAALRSALAHKRILPVVPGISETKIALGAAVA